MINKRLDIASSSFREPLEAQPVPRDAGDVVGA
jgi:hypothetical protein